MRVFSPLLYQLSYLAPDVSRLPPSAGFYFASHEQLRECLNCGGGSLRSGALARRKSALFKRQSREASMVSTADGSPPTSTGKLAARTQKRYFERRSRNQVQERERGKPMGIRAGRRVAMEMGPSRGRRAAETIHGSLSAAHGLRSRCRASCSAAQARDVRRRVDDAIKCIPSLEHCKATPSPRQWRSRERTPARRRSRACRCHSPPVATGLARRV